MPAINLPSLNLTGVESNNQEVLNNILDTLQLYRKELNFYLMNLDGDNMPSVIGRIEDGEGNISLINQTIDEIQLLVSNNAGDIASLRIFADNLSITVGNNSQDIANLTVRATSIESTVANQAGDISVLQQTAQSIQSTVANQAGQISTLQQTASGLQSTVQSISSTVGTHTSQITQLSNQITSKVSYTDYNGNTIVSIINQSASSIKIQASHIDLYGITRIYAPNDTSTYFQVSDSILTYISDGTEALRIQMASIHGYYGVQFMTDYSLFGFYNDVRFDNTVSFHDDADFWGNADFMYPVEFDDDVRFYGDANFRGMDVYFNTDVEFNGDVDFSGADVYGLDIDIPEPDLSDVIRAYYTSNRCYIDYGGGSRLTIRDKYGDVVGYLTLE